MATRVDLSLAGQRIATNLRAAGCRHRPGGNHSFFLDGRGDAASETRHHSRHRSLCHLSTDRVLVCLQWQNRGQCDDFARWQARRVFGAAHVRCRSTVFRSIDDLTSRAIDGTANASFPFWSPDSDTIGFFADGKLKTVGLDGAPPVIVCEAPNGRGGTWNRDGVILFQAGSAVNTQGISRVSSSGGIPSEVTSLAPGEGDHRFPSFLPDGDRFFYYVNDNASIFVGSLKGDTPVKLLQGVSSSAVLASTGHLLYAKQGTLLAHAFDPKTLQFTGQAFSIALNVASAFQGQQGFSVSGTGTLVYGSDSSGGSAARLTWVDRAGKTLGTVGPEGLFRGIDISPDERHLVFHRDDANGGGDVWMLDLHRDTVTRITAAQPRQHNGPAVFSHSGLLAYGADIGPASSDHKNSSTWAIHVRPAAGLSDEETVVDSQRRVNPMSWAPDGSIVYQYSGEETGEDILVLPGAGGRQPFVFQAATGPDTHPQVSPDGKWIAYQSRETGTGEVYVRSFPTGKTKRIVSISAGGLPRRRRDGKELFYVRTASFASGMIVAVPFTATPSGIALGPPKTCLTTGISMEALIAPEITTHMPCPMMGSDS
jgi:eukaryotic-like serine/threonine-protein kinase